MAVFTVTNLLDNGKGSLRQAIARANSLEGTDIIKFSRNLKGSTITLTSGELSITDSVTLKGLGAEWLKISGNDSSRIFNIDDGSDQILEVLISDLTLTEGRTTGSEDFAARGGAIFNANETLTLINTSITGSTAQGASVDFYDYYNDTTWSGGGAIYNSSGNLTIINSVISGNTAKGGTSYQQYQYLYAGGSASGGGIFNATGNLSVTNSIISGNTAIGGDGELGGSGHGGGISNRGSLTVTNSIISDNTAEGSYGDGSAWGGGIEGSNITVNNSTISNNTAIGGRGRQGIRYRSIEPYAGSIGGYASGGGILGANLIVNNSTITGNTAIGGEGGRGAYGYNSSYLALAEGVMVAQAAKLEAVASGSWV